MPFEFNADDHGIWPQRAALQAWCREADAFLERDVAYRRGTLAADLVGIHRDTRTKMARTIKARGDEITDSEAMLDARSIDQFRTGRAEWSRRSNALHDIYDPNWRAPTRPAPSKGRAPSRR